MMTAAEREDPLAAAERGAGGMAGRWLAVTDHQALARRYLAGMLVFLALGGLAALAMRFALLRPAGAAPESFARLFSFHGMILVYFVMAPAFPAVLGNLVLPGLAGLRGMAFPRLNALAWHLYAAGGALVLASTVLGGTTAGWTLLAPGTNGSPAAFACAGTGILLAALSMILTAVNQLATLGVRPRTGRAPLPVFAASLAVSAGLAVATWPFLALSVVLVLLERATGAGVLRTAAGADPQVAARLFWFFATPATHMILLPALGAVSEIVAERSGRPLWGVRGVKAAFVVFALLGFALSGRHLLGAAPPSALFTSLLNHAAAAPFLFVVAAWVLTLRGGAVRMDAALLYALSVPVLAVGGVLTGLMLAAPGVRDHLHNTTFVVAHFHYLMIGGALMAFLGALHFRWPEIAGRAGPAGAGIAGAVLCFAGVNLAFLPLLLLGAGGALRRFAALAEGQAAGQAFATAGATVLLAGLALAAGALLASYRRRPLTV